MTEITMKQVWGSLTSAEKEDACLSFWSGTDAYSRDSQMKVSAEMAAALRFREVFLKRLKPQEKARHLKRLADGAALAQYRDEILRSWLLAKKSDMLVCFVEAQGMRHTGGLIEDDVASPDRETLRKGVRALRDKFPPRETALYMGIMISSAGEFWVGLPEIVEQEIPGLAALLAPA